MRKKKKKKYVIYNHFYFKIFFSANQKVECVGKTTRHGIAEFELQNNKINDDNNKTNKQLT